MEGGFGYITSDFVLRRRYACAGVAEVFGGPAAFRFRKKVANLRDLCRGLGFLIFFPGERSVTSAPPGGLQKCVEAEEAQNQEIEADI